MPSDSPFTALVPDHRFAAVAEQLRKALESGDEVGAAVAVWQNDRLLLAAHGGWADRRRQRPWQADTLCCCFSISKAITAVCVLMAVDDGRVELDGRVADYWPEFAAEGKGDVTVRQLLSHRAGLVGFHDPVPRDLLFDWPAVTAKLATESPWWPPGSAHGYHARTFGFLLGEVLRRATGLGPAEWLRDRICGPLELDLYFGVADADLERCADMIPARVRAGSQDHLPQGARQMYEAMKEPGSPTAAAFQNPAMGPGSMNSREFRQAVIPAMNAHGAANSIARLFAAIPRLVSEATLAEARRTHSYGEDQVLRSTSRFGLGFMLHDPEAPIGLTQASFGHAGAGGSIAFHDADHDLGFCFLMNQMREGVVSGNETALSLLASCRQALLEG